MKTTQYGSAFPERWRYYLKGAEVEAPLDWEDVIFEFARNKESDGVVMMPSIPVKFGGKGAETIRRHVYLGLEGSLTFRIDCLQVDGSVETYFEGALSMESFVDSVDSVEIQAEDASLENLVNSKAKVTYGIPFTDTKRVQLPSLGLSLRLEAVNTDGVTRYTVPGGNQPAAVHDMALPVEVTLKGDPFLYDPAAPDVLKAKQAMTLLLTVTANFKGTVTVTADPDNAGTVNLNGSVGGSPYIALVVYGTDGTEKSVNDLKPSESNPITLWLERNDLVTLELRGASFGTVGAAGDNYLNFTWGKTDASKPLVSVTCSTKKAVAGRFACLTARDAFTALMDTIADGMQFAVEYQDGLGLENYALFTTGAIVGAESGVLKASFNDFRDFFALLGIGVAFDEQGGNPRCYVAFNTRTDETEALWPTAPSALITDVGDGWTDMALKFNEEALFGSVEIGWNGVKDYEIIPNLSDYCGKATYVNGQNDTSTTKQLLSKWRADALGIADLLMQAELNGADTVQGDDIWVLACMAGGSLIADGITSAGLTFYIGVTRLYNLALRPTALMGYVKPLLAVPLALYPDAIGVMIKVYKWVSASNEIALYVGGKPDNPSIDVEGVSPTHYPIYAAFSSSVRANLWRIMKDPAKRYGYISFTYRGVTLKGFIRSLQYNPTEESCQRCELYLTPDSDLSGLIK